MIQLEPDSIGYAIRKCEGKNLSHTYSFHFHICYVISILYVLDGRTVFNIK